MTASCCFVWKYAQKLLVFRGVPFPIIAWPQVSVHSNANWKHYNGIRSIRIHIRTTSNLVRMLQKPFKWLELAFKWFESLSKHLKGLRSIRMQILTIWKGCEAIESKFKPLERNQSIRMQTRTIWKGFESLKCKLKLFERDSNHSNTNLNQQWRV